jgi:small nuclear ribonucleoprotein B and B'
MPRTNKTLELVGRRVRVLTHDGRALVGQLLAYDKHMNVVIAECEEFRRTRRHSGPGAGTARRTLGLVVLRGRHVSAMTPDNAAVPVDAARVPLAAVPPSSSLPPRSNP